VALHTPGNVRAEYEEYACGWDEESGELMCYAGSSSRTPRGPTTGLRVARRVRGGWAWHDVHLDPPLPRRF